MVTFESLSSEIAVLAQKGKDIETQIKELQWQLLATRDEMLEKAAELGEIVVAAKSFSSQATVVRTFFVTPYHGADIAKLADDLQTLGAIAFESARKLAAARGWSEWEGRFVMPINIIFRVDFGSEVKRKVVAQVRGINKVRATLEHAPQGINLPAASRPIPPLPKPPKTPANPQSMNSLRREKFWKRRA